jgi:hypothetical protein
MNGHGPTTLPKQIGLEVAEVIKIKFINRKYGFLGIAHSEKKKL